jgi:hypothetical protein
MTAARVSLNVLLHRTHSCLRSLPKTKEMSPAMMMNRRVTVIKVIEKARKMSKVRKQKKA